MLLDLRSLQESSGSAVANSLSGAAGTYAITGNEAGFKVARNLSGNAGSYSVTGQAGSSQVARLLSGSAGSYSLSGQTATFNVGRLLTGDAGSYALSGQSATFDYTPGASAYALSGDAGSYAITGIDAAFSYAPNVIERTVSAPSGVRSQYVEIDGKISRVRSYEEAERLILKHKKEQKKDEKKLKVLVKKYEVSLHAPTVQKQIAEVEKRIDMRWQIMSDLYQLIDRELQKMDEEEALMVLLQ